MNDFEEFNVTPELTLDPFQEEKKETPQIYQEAEPETPEIVLTPEEKNMVSAFAEKIDLANSNMILQYGAGTQKKIADFSEKALENVKTKDLGEVGTLLSDVVTELKGFDGGRGKRIPRNLQKRRKQDPDNESQICKSRNQCKQYCQSTGISRSAAYERHCASGQDV